MRDRGTVLEYRPRDAAEQARALPANVELEQQFLGSATHQQRHLPHGLGLSQARALL